MRKFSKTFCILIVFSIILTSTIPKILAKPPKNDIKSLFNVNNAFAHIEAITDFGPRIAGSSAEEATADYVAAQMESYGLEVEIQQFPFIYFEDFGPTLEVVGGPALNPNTMKYSPSGEFTAEIVDCDLGYPADFPLSVSGKIALIQRGDLSFFQKTQNAADAGALAVIIYNDKPSNYLGTLMSIATIPAVSISQEEGNTLLSLLATGSVTVYLKVDTAVYPSTSQNVIGTKEGLDPAQGIVYVGAHCDTVSASPGANDDASGLAAMLEAARILSTKGHRTKATLKFIAFGAHETGQDGSYHYTFTNLVEVSTMGIGMIDLDMIAVGDTLQIGNLDAGGPMLKDYTMETAENWGLNWIPIVTGVTGDHFWFENAGVPSVSLSQTPDPWYHTAEDTPDKIDITRLEENGELATSVMYDWAKNPELRSKKT